MARTSQSLMAKGDRCHGDDWVVDSGCSHHMSGQRNLFSVITTKEVPLAFADGPSAVKARIGFLKRNNLGLHAALYHPRLQGSLLSVETFCRDGGAYSHREDKRTLTRRDGSTHGVACVNGLPVVRVSFELVSGRYAVFTTPSGNKVSELRLHERRCHLYKHGKKCSCQICAKSKPYGQATHRAKRPAKYEKSKWLEMVQVDFKGPFTESLFGSKLVFSIMDMATGWVESYGCKSKNEAGEKLKEFVTEIGKPEAARSDNEPVLRGLDSAWKFMCRALGVHPTHSVPFEPQGQGNIERWHRVLGDALRSCLSGVDKSLWDYCARYVAYVFTRVERKPDTPSAYRKRFLRSAPVDHLRRFGCVCYSKVQDQDGSPPVLHPRYEKGVFLGCSRVNSSYIVGHYRMDDRCNDGYRFTVAESSSVKFFEDDLVLDLNSLRADAVKQYAEKEFGAAGGGSREPPQAVELERGSDKQAGDRSKSLDDGAVVIKPVSEPTPPSETRTQHIVDSIVPPTGLKRGNSDTGVPPPKRVKSSAEKPAEPIVGKKRGRKPGTKMVDNPHWKKPGRKPKAKLARARANLAAGKFSESDVKAVMEQLPKSCDDHLEEGESAVAWTVQLTQKQAFSGPQRERFIVADNLEKA